MKLVSGTVARAIALVMTMSAGAAAVAATGWGSVAGKVEATRVVEDGGRVHPSGGQGSHVLGALAGATALALVPADVEHVAAGDVVRCIPLLGQEDRHG